jgi:hypothetical protein
MSVRVFRTIAIRRRSIQVTEGAELLYGKLASA